MSELKLLMSSAKSTMYLAPQYFKFIQEELGSENVLGFYHNDQFNAYYNRGVLNKIYYKIYPSQIENRIFKNLVQLCENFKPNVVLIFKGMELTPRAIRYLKNKDIFLVNYNLDHPFKFFGKGSGNKNVLNSLPLYDLHITYSKHIEKDLKHKFNNINVSILPFGYALADNLYEKIIESFEETNRVCFIGNPDEQRKTFITSFLNANLKVDVYGEGWKKVGLSHENLSIFNAVYNDNYWKTLRKYRVQLNMFRPHNFNSHNMRTFEVPAVGGIMLGPFSEEHHSFFKNGSEAFFYNSGEEAIGLAQKLLSLPLQEANQIRENARLRSLSSGYSYKERAKQLVQSIKKEINE
jgi:spore maturation protein CgeB